MGFSEDSSVLGQFIPLHYHHNMLADSHRMKGFKRAIAHVVTPGKKVLELGGGTGALSFFAAQTAEKVWCVERNPELVSKAREFLALNNVGGKVDVVEADAFDFLPPERVDVVICEMLHVGMLREKQIPVLSSFKERYLSRFGLPLPVFVPEAVIQAVQLVEHNFDFEGFRAPLPVFQHPHEIHPRTMDLSPPVVYQLLAYQDSLPTKCAWRGEIPAERSGFLNGLRFITKNVLAVLLETKSTLDWHSHYLILPLAVPRQVAKGDMIQVKFSYMAGGSFTELENSIEIVIPKFPTVSTLPIRAA